MTKILSWVVLLLVVLLVVSGCGGGSDVQPDPEPAEESSEPAQEEQAVEADEEEEVAVEEEAEESVPADTETAEGEEMTLPADLTTVHDFNKFATDLMIEKIKPGIFDSPVFSDADKEEARKALVLIIAAYDEAIKLYDQNEHIFYNRGRAHKQVYLDTKNPADKEKALADFNKALEMGLGMAQTEIDSLSD
jgi:hypothetical protein